MLTEFLDQVRSFALARVLMTAIELNLFQVLAETPLSRTDLTGRLAIADTPIANAFFDILIAFDILAESNGKLVLLPLGRSILPVYESVQSWSREMQLFYDSMVNLTEFLQTGDYQDSALAHFWAYKHISDRNAIPLSLVEEYSNVMDASQVQLSQLIVEHYNFSQHKHIIDFGGGKGRLAIALAKKYPGLKITIIDLPIVRDSVRTQIETEGLASRIRFLPLDFFKDDLPTAVADAMLFVRVLHDWNDDEVRYLFQRTRPCLQDSGVMVVIEPMLNSKDGKPDPSASLTSLMLTLFGGRRRSAQEYVQFLRSAGYNQVSWSELGLSLYKVVVGHSLQSPLT